MLDFPPLPEVWGNYVIRGIEEVLQPEAVSWWPQAPGWKYVAMGLVLLAAWYGWRRWQHWVRNRYRQAALRQLQELVEAHGDSTQLLLPLASLLKATALQAFPRREVAALSGEAWVTWLNVQQAKCAFNDTSGHLLARAQYLPPGQVESQAIAELASQVRYWIRHHRGPERA